MTVRGEPQSTNFDDFVNEVEKKATDVERQELDSARQRFSIGARLLARRTAAGFTQQQLAEEAGIPQSEISRIERGQANPTLQTLEALGAPLGMTLDYATAGSVEEDI